MLTVSDVFTILIITIPSIGIAGMVIHTMDMVEAGLYPGIWDGDIQAMVMDIQVTDGDIQVMDGDTQAMDGDIRVMVVAIIRFIHQIPTAILMDSEDLQVQMLIETM